MPLRSNSSNYLDRFIPNRSAMNLSFTHCVLAGDCGIEKESIGLYRRRIAESLNMNRTIILGLNHKAPYSVKNNEESFLRRIHQTPEWSLDAPDLVDAPSLNLLDWGSNNLIAIALGSIVHLWNASDNSIETELDFTDHGIGPVTSLKWAPNGRHLAVALNNSHVQLWDCDALDTRLLRTLQGGHSLRVSSLDWRNDHILTSGGMDGMIINNDVRKESHIVSTYKGHSQEVSCLKWCSSGRQLASGGNDKLLYIWCVSMASSKSSNKWLHRLNNHSAAINSLSWCPFQSNLLATGGGPCIKVWKTNTGACLNSVTTGSEVCSLLWNTHERELLSGHSYNENLLTLWKYPSMVSIAELYGDADSSRVLSMAKSPDGYNVATVASDESLKIWNVFGTPPITKRKGGEPYGPFPNIPRIR